MIVANEGERHAGDLRRRANQCATRDLVCPARFAKIFLFSRRSKSVIFLTVPSHSEGRLAIVTKRGAGCDGRGWRLRRQRYARGRQRRVVLILATLGSSLR